MKKNNKLIKRASIATLSGVLLLGMGAQAAYAEPIAAPYVSLGADLNPEQRAVVLSLLELTEEDLAKYTVMEVTNDQEHYYLDAYLPPEIIGDQAWSSARIHGKERGHGITVSTQNINYCTASMYANALVTAGVSDAEILVAGPVPISGTAALIGIMNAYADMNDKELDAENVDAATDELVTTSQLGDELGDQEKAAELIAAIKEAVAESGIDDEEQAAELIDRAAEEMDITLTEDQKNQLLELMQKLSKLDLDVDNLKEQAKGIYEKLEGMNLNLNQEEVQGFFAKIGQFFAKIWDILISWFNKLS